VSANNEFNKLQKEHEALGWSFYSKKISNTTLDPNPFPSTLVLYHTKSKQFTTFIYVNGDITRIDMFLILAEDKAEKIGKQEVKPYTIKKSDKGFWEIEDI